MEKTHFHFGKDEILLSSSLPKTLSKLERNISKRYYSILENQNKENSDGGSFGEVSRCRRMTRRLALLCFVAVSCLPSTSSRSGPLGGMGFTYWNKGRSKSLWRIAKVSMLPLKLQIPETEEFSSDIETK
ncbi:hypothetical protein H5410_014336 [Solanum commersonii]|uniref:Uncharacterized protein n=1 Tax=Solanum commersonii TaxID=4109 RepID=A0A9J5ZQQ5_SOLCO|nr:hypothetical protein H5410_014336 [Solanum commersonii]